MLTLSSQSALEVESLTRDCPPEELMQTHLKASSVLRARSRIWSRNRPSSAHPVDVPTPAMIPHTKLGLLPYVTLQNGVSQSMDDFRAVRVGISDL